MKIKVKKIFSDAKLPVYAHRGDAGMDIYSNEDLTILPKHRAIVKTGIALEFPPGYVALVWDKSGLSKKGITTLGGVMDSGYRGEYKIILLNISSVPYEIKKGEKIAQILIQKIIEPEIVEVEKINDSSRGEKGFGSTGLV